MGSYVFRWPYPADDVHVTGTFDDWGKTVQLNKVGDVWEKEVDLPSADETIYYKFVVDNMWIVDDAAPKTDDGHWNINNILRPEHIKRKQVEPTQSTPGAFPETPAAEKDTFMVNPIPASSGASNPISLPAGQKVPDSKEISSYTVGSTATTSKEDYEKAGTGDFPSYKTGEAAEYSVNPIPASSGVGNPVHLAAGEKAPESKDVTSNTIDSTATTSKEDYDRAGTTAFPSSATGSEPANYSVSPIPASSGIGNPISLPAGAKVPESKDVTTNTVDSTATTSKEDYDNAGQRSTGAIAGIAAGATAGSAVIGGAIASAFKAPEEKKNLIPESSLPMGGEAVDTMDRGPFISSSGPGTTASELAARVPLEKKRDATVIDPDSTSSSTAPFLSSAAPASTTAGLAAGVPLAEKRQGMVIDPSNTPSSSSPFISSTGPGTSASALAAGVPLEQKREATTIDPSTTATASVPETVKDSLAQAHKDPEASASAEAVREKTDMEKELLSKTQRSEATGGPSIYAGVPAPVQHSLARAHQEPEAATSPEAVKEKTDMEKELLSKTHRSEAAGEQGIYAGVPAAVQQSLAKSHEGPEAAASSEAVEEKTQMERELLSKTQRSEATGAPAAAAAAQSSYYGLATTVPQAVESSMQKAHAAPEAAADTAAVAEKSAMEQELLAKVKSTDEAGEPAPTLAAATSATAPMTTTSAHKSTGSSPFAAAAVSDGTTDIPEVGSKISHPVEKSEGQTTEYAPVRTDGSAPGVSSAAAAALSDGTEDPTLIDEPAVQMMHQNEAGTTIHDTTTFAEPVAETSAHASADKDILAATTTTAHDATTSPVANPDYTTSATVHDVAGLPSTTIQEATDTGLKHDGAADTTANTTSVATETEKNNIVVPQNDTSAAAVSATAPETKATGVTGSSTSAIPIVSGIPTMASTGTMDSPTTGTKATGPALIGTGSVPAPSTPSAPSTPAKKTAATSAASSPAGSAATGDTNKKKKHRHRISAFFHKLLD